MSELKVEVLKINNIIPHENADKLEIAIIKGWNCVIPKNVFNIDDYVVYFPIDSILPEELENKIFPPESKIKLEKHRIKTIKIRGAISQGLVIKPTEILGQDILKTLFVGKDLTEQLGVKKYEPPEEQQASLRGNQPKKSKKHSNFPKYTDIQNFKNYNNLFTDQDFVVATEKLHGCLQSRTKITLADGQKIKIKDILKNDNITHVLGYKNGKLVPSKILNKFNNGKCDEWYKIKIEKKRLKGNYYKSIITTKNHKFFVPDKNEYISVENLREGDNVLSTYNELQLLNQKILKIEKINKLPDNNCNKYDLETETHNFFANDILVHNSNMRVGYIQSNKKWKLFLSRIFDFLKINNTFCYDFVFGSHNVELKNPSKKNFYTKSLGKNVYWEMIEKYNLKEILKKYPNYIFYGEVIGDGIQKNYKYGCKQNERRLVFFDVYDIENNSFLDYEDFDLFYDKLDIEIAPLLYQGSFDLDKIKQKMLSNNGNSFYCKEQDIIEGVVIKSYYESKCSLGRKILKLINDEYLLRKGNTDLH